MENCTDGPHNQGSPPSEQFDGTVDTVGDSSFSLSSGGSRSFSGNQSSGEIPLPPLNYGYSPLLSQRHSTLHGDGLQTQEPVIREPVVRRTNRVYMYFITLCVVLILAVALFEPAIAQSLFDSVKSHVRRLIAGIHDFKWHQTLGNIRRYGREDV